MTHDQIHTLIRAVVFLALSGTAAICAVPGWLLPLRDGVARFTWRYLACGAWAVSFCWVAFDGPWYMTVFSFAFGGYLLGRTRHWWREVEQQRKLRRAIAAWKGGAIHLPTDDLGPFGDVSFAPRTDRVR